MHLSLLSRHINPYNPTAQNTLMAIKQAFMARGIDAATATQQANAAAFGMVQQQAAMMAYIDTFFLLAVMFVACLPLIFIMKKAPKGGGGPRGDWALKIADSAFPDFSANSSARLIFAFPGSCLTRLVAGSSIPASHSAKYFSIASLRDHKFPKAGPDHRCVRHSCYAKGNALWTMPLTPSDCCMDSPPVFG